MGHIFTMIGPFSAPLISLHKPLMGVGHVYVFHYTSRPWFSVIGQVGKILIQNIDTKFCPSLNWTLFYYDRTHFLFLHLAIGVQARHLTFAQAHSSSAAYSYKTTRFAPFINYYKLLYQLIIWCVSYRLIYIIVTLIY